MTISRWLPTLFIAATLVAGCAGGSPTAPPLAQQAVPNSAAPPQQLSTTTAPAAAIKKIDDSVGSTSAAPTWQFLEPLRISQTGTFSPAQSGGSCSPVDPIFGIWYIALNSFTLPTSGSSLPSCTTAHKNLYVVELSVSLFSVNVTPIAGPGVTNNATSYFAPMENNLSFTRDTLYSFFLASYNGPAFAQPDVTCEAGSTTCSLGANPTPGNELVVVVSDGSGQLPNLVVKDSAGNALKQETISPNCGHCVAVYDESVPSGITGTVGYTIGGNPYYLFYPNVSAIYELDDVTSGRFASTNTGAIPSSLASTISGVTRNDVQLCAYIQTGVTSPGNITLAFSNGSSETYDYQSAGAVFAHEIATANASSSCTANNINAAYQAGMAYADYP